MLFRMTRARLTGVLILLTSMALWHWADGEPAVAPTTAFAWWRFEDVEPGHWLDARLGGTRPPFSVTANFASDGRHPLRTFNTRPTAYPPDTSADFSNDVATERLNGGIENHRSVRFNGKQYLYTTDNDAGPARGGSVTIEGMFKLAILPGDYTGKTQTILCRISAPVTQPAVEHSDQLATRPTTDRTTRPTTTTTPTTAETEPDPGPTELANDHPAMPVIALVAGNNDSLARRNHFAFGVLDHDGHRHTIASRDPVRANQWYAFAAVVGTDHAELFLSEIDPRGYVSQGTTPVPGGMIGGRGIWNLGCGLVDDQHDDWFQGWVDEVKLSTGTVIPANFLATGCKPAPRSPAPPASEAVTPLPVVKGLADPEVRLFDGVYYLYGTRDQSGYPVYTSTDLVHWKHGPTVFERTRMNWGESRFWAPSVIQYRGKFFLFYSALGPLHNDGDRHSLRVCVARSDSPLGPFVDTVAPLPLNGKAAIDPAVFVDTDGKAYLYFVADCSENVISQVYAVQLNDDLTGTVGEPVLCIQPTQVWEGTVWNEGPNVFKTGGIYVLMYSADWWHSPNYGVGFATSRSPLGPWTKNPTNPVLQRYHGLLATGGSCAVQSPGGNWSIFFHADGPADSKRRDTYMQRLVITPDERLGVSLKVMPPA